MLFRGLNTLTVLIILKADDPVLKLSSIILNFFDKLKILPTQYNNKINDIPCSAKI